MWHERTKEITKEDYEAIKNGDKDTRDFFSTAQIWGYGAIPGSPYEKDG